MLQPPPISSRRDPLFPSTPLFRSCGVARHLVRPLFDDRRETLLLAGFDAFDRLLGLECVEGDASGRCVIPPQSWRALLRGGVRTVVMAHNPPSGIASPSEAAIERKSVV